MSSGVWVRDIASVATIGTGFFPTYLSQSSDRQLYIQAFTDGRVVRFDPNTSTVETLSIGAKRRIAATARSLWCVNAISGIDSRDRTTWLHGSSFGTTLVAFGLQEIDDRWALALGATAGKLWLLDSTLPTATTLLYAGSQIFDVNLVSGSRILVADLGANSVYELLATTTPSATDPLGLPMSLGRSVAVTQPLSVAELTSGDWLVGGSKGLYVYSHTTGLLKSKISSDSFRTIEYFEGR